MQNSIADNRIPVIKMKLKFEKIADLPAQKRGTHHQLRNQNKVNKKLNMVSNQKWSIFNYVNNTVKQKN